MKILTDTGLLVLWNKIKQLVLGNRPYNPSDFSGKGYKVLEKNIQTVGGVKKNILTAIMLSEANTIYEVRYDFDLNGETIEMQEGCTLKFCGGSLKNGTLKGNNSIIDSRCVQIFNEAFVINGSWNVHEAYPEWFGAVGDGNVDDTKAIQKTFDTFNLIRLSRKEYKVETIDQKGVVLNLPKNKHLIGMDIDHNAENTIYSLHCENPNAKVILQINSGCIVENITLRGVSQKASYNTYNDALHGFCCIKTNGECNRITLTEVQCLSGDVGFFLMAYLTNIDHCYSFYNKIGFAITGNISEDGSIKVENTTINMRTCYCIYCNMCAFYIKGIIYSNFENLAADGCGHDLKTINSWDDVKAPYYLESLKTVNFLSVGAESSLKMIKTYNCVNIGLYNINFTYGFHSNEQLGGTYTPGHLFEFKYSYIRMVDAYLNIGGVAPDKIKELLEKDTNAPLIYIEDNKTSNIKYRFYGFVERLKKDNIKLGGAVNINNVYIEDYIVNNNI